MRKSIVSTALIYKFFTAWGRIYLGAVMILLGLDLHRMARVLLDTPILNHLLNYFLIHIRVASRSLTLFLALTIIIFSLMELVFIFSLALGKRWGAIGLFIISIIWIPVMILFVSKFLLLSKTITIIINLIIIYILYRIIVDKNPNQK